MTLLMEILIVYNLVLQTKFNDEKCREFLCMKEIKTKQVYIIFSLVQPSSYARKNSVFAILTMVCVHTKKFN